LTVIGLGKGREREGESRGGEGAGKGRKREGKSRGREGRGGYPQLGSLDPPVKLNITT